MRVVARGNTITMRASLRCRGVKVVKGISGEGSRGSRDSGGRGHCIGEHAQSSMIVCLCCASERQRERERRSDSSRQLLNTQTKLQQKLHFKLPNTTWYFLYTVINDLLSDNYSSCWQSLQHAVRQVEGFWLKQSSWRELVEIVRV